MAIRSTSAASFIEEVRTELADAESDAGQSPAEVAQLETVQLIRMQEYLAKRGFYSDKIDGKAGMKTRLALGAYQKAAKLKLDCWPTRAVATA